MLCLLCALFCLFCGRFIPSPPQDLPVSRSGLPTDALLTLRVLPYANLNGSAPIYFESPPPLTQPGLALALNSVTAVHTFVATLTASD